MNLDFNPNAFFDEYENLISAFLLLATVYFAYKGANATAQSNELRLMPFFKFSFEDKYENVKFFLTNHGEGVASNIQIDPWDMIITDIQEIYRLEMSIPGMSLLAKDQQVTIQTKCILRNNNHVADSFKEVMMFYIQTPNKHINPIITLRFNNALGKRYFMQIKTNFRGIEVITFPIELNLLSRFKLFLQNTVYGWFKVKSYQLVWRFKKPTIDWGK